MSLLTFVYLREISNDSNISIIIGTFGMLTESCDTVNVKSRMDIKTITSYLSLIA